MKVHLIAAAATLAAAVAAPALAAETEGASFTGFRIEGHGGYDRIGVDAGTYGLGKYHKSGASYGVGVGYDFPLGSNLIAGVELNGDLSSTKECQSSGTVRVCVKARRDLSALARIGYKLDRALLYAKVGYSNARLKATYRDSAFPVDDFSTARNLDGVRAGVGVEFAFSRNLYIKGEYQYSNYQSGVDRNQVLGGVGIRF